MNYRPCDPATAAGWKSFPVRIPGPGRSTCHDAPTILVESKRGGYVTSNCSRCGEFTTLSRAEFSDLKLPINCPECRGPMRTHVPQWSPSVRLPTSNYAFRCDECRVYVELHWLLPKWSDLFTRQSAGVGFQDWAGGGGDRVPPAAADSIYCPTCKKVAACGEVDSGPLTQSHPPGNYYWPTFPDLHWNRRVRACRECNHQFVTGELDEAHIDELVKLRNALETLKGHAELYATRSQAVSAALAQLTQSLGSLLTHETGTSQPSDQADF